MKITIEKTKVQKMSRQGKEREKERELICNLSPLFINISLSI